MEYVMEGYGGAHQGFLLTSHSMQQHQQKAASFNLILQH